MSGPVRERILRKAAMNKTLSARVAVAFQQNPNPNLLTAASRRDLVEAIRIARGLDKEAKADVAQINKLPGFSPMQLRQQIDKIAKIRQEAEILRKQYEEVLKQLSDLEKEEAAGVKKLKEAAEKMGTTGKYIAEAENALLEWTAYTQAKRPGIEQMIARSDDPDVAKKGLKAGDLFGRIATKLGKEIAEQVETIYKETSEDLTATAYALRGLKVVVKTSSLNPVIIKKAGIGDIVFGMKDWLKGKVNSAVKSLLHFGGSISDWVKGFAIRSKNVGKAKTDLTKAIAEARRETDKLLKAV